MNKILFVFYITKMATILFGLKHEINFDKVDEIREKIKSLNEKCDSKYYVHHDIYLSYIYVGLVMDKVYRTLDFNEIKDKFNKYGETINDDAELKKVLSTMNFSQMKMDCFIIPTQ